MRKWLFCLLPLSVYALAKEPRIMPAQGVDKALLGQILFFDNSLSFQGNLNCASCHNPDHAFVDTRETSANKMVSQGDDLISFGKRNSPTMLYAKFSPDFYFDEKIKSISVVNFGMGAHNICKIKQECHRLID
ncbi:Cytochrome c peroxidase [Bibersteinia trehalosi USDA-ARS-USMARC-189]|uniref:Cytochrome c peroxidase n=1 Tax=Bibersteinia trehalosi USDA-ARS-USMARC-189 TaxID=1263831 RepID=A0ABM5PEX8_BIBTR|nr:Cytochrome c peroxidase [Bibersteinia trehalosi USDA-ARS-USMARC-189]